MPDRCPNQEGMGENKKETRIDRIKEKKEKKEKRSVEKDEKEKNRNRKEKGEGGAGPISNCLCSRHLTPRVQSQQSEIPDGHLA